MKPRFIALPFLLMFGCAAAAQVVDLPQIGGPGGGPFNDLCKPSDVLIGFNVLDGKAMNQFAAVCQAQNNGVFVGPNYGLRTWGQFDQDIPHLFLKPRCPSGSAITALQVWVNKFHELDSVAATCSPLRPNSGGVSALERTLPMGGQAVMNSVVTCPQGMFAIGVTGRSGALMDSISLKCSPLGSH